jgi:hypothetical protein
VRQGLHTLREQGIERTCTARIQVRISADLLPSGRDGPQVRGGARTARGGNQARIVRHDHIAQCSGSDTALEQVEQFVRVQWRGVRRDEVHFEVLARVTGARQQRARGVEAERRHWSRVCLEVRNGLEGDDVHHADHSGHRGGTHLRGGTVHGRDSECRVRTGLSGDDALIQHVHGLGGQVHDVLGRTAHRITCHREQIRRGLDADRVRRVAVRVLARARRRAAQIIVRRDCVRSVRRRIGEPARSECADPVREGQIWCRVELRGGSDTLGLLGIQHPESRGGRDDEHVSVGLEIDQRRIELDAQGQQRIGGERVELDAVLTALFA